MSPKTSAGLAHLVAVAQGPEDDALAARLQHHRPLAARQHQPRNADRVGRLHRLADHREGLLRDLVVGHEVIGRVVPDPLDAVGRHELLDVDRARALEPDRLELLVLDDDVAVLLDLVAADLVLVLYRLAGLGVDIAAADAVAGLGVEGVEAHLLALARRRGQRHRAGDERELEVALPIGARRHRLPPLPPNNAPAPEMFRLPIRFGGLLSCHANQIADFTSKPAPARVGTARLRARLCRWCGSRAG